MTTRDDWNSVAKRIKEEMDRNKLAFKTYNIKDLEKLFNNGNANLHKDFDSLENALMRVGFTTFPSLADEQEGHTRIYRAGSLIATLLNAITAPGEGSDEELSTLIGKIKKSRNILKPIIE